MRYARLLASLLIIATIVPMVAAQCEDSFNYSYTNNDDRADRVTFVLLNKTTADMNVVFAPRTLIVNPDETKSFSLTATSSEPLPGVQSAGFAVRDGTEIVAYGTALFDLTCGNETAPPDSTDTNERFVISVFGYSLVILIIAVLIVWFVVALLDRRGPVREREHVQVDEHGPERRAPVKVDAMIRAERERSEHTQWWLWMLIILIVLVVIFAGIYLVVSGSDVSGFNYGAGINLTNAS